MHDSWAHYYDFVYDECFGSAFWRLTAETLSVIAEHQPSPARVLDLGAGTGRLAVPLALLGYEVTAVEHSTGMADAMERRVAELGAVLDLRRQDVRAVHAADASDGPTPRVPYDIAIAIFTVLNYLVTEDDIHQLGAAVGSSLRRDGRFVFDLAARRLFAPATFESRRFQRRVDVRPLSPVTFEYRDSGCGVMNGQRFRYDEVFTLRYWRDEEVLPILAEHGLTFEADVTDRLRESGSRWFVLRRR